MFVRNIAQKISGAKDCINFYVSCGIRRKSRQIYAFSAALDISGVRCVILYTAARLQATFLGSVGAFFDVGHCRSAAIRSFLLLCPGYTASPHVLFAQQKYRRNRF